ncbi:MAG: helix-turn-helix domain-containing protein [Bacteroidetes bacterium]|nr:helix-turn-helix domain-containing protein [Bacteroidota bacterium]
MRQERTAIEIKYLQAIGISIARLRHKNGLTQVELGKLIHSNQATIWRYESGATMPDILMLRKIAIAMNIPIQTIFDGVDELLRNDIYEL